MDAEVNLHSAGRRDVPFGELPPPIRCDVEELRAVFPAAGVRCLHWNEHYVAVHLHLGVDLPSRGPVSEIDIRPIEPVLLLFHLRRYPRKPPLVYADRRDFPVARLPHLNPTSTPNLAWLCLHRGSLDDWFAEHGLTVFVDRIRGWLRDAAADRLIRPEDGFEGTRIQDSFGIVVYPPANLISTVEAQWATRMGASGSMYLMATLLKNESAKAFYPAGVSYRINFPLVEPPSGKIVDVFTRYNHVLGDNPQEDRLLFGLLMWSPRIPSGEYFGALPSTYGHLKTFCARLGIDLGGAVDAYRTQAQLLGGVPIVVALLRPQLLIGMTSAVELLHFAVLASDEHCDAEGRWREDAPVFPLSHRTPLTAAFARELSRENPKASPSALALVGCGAVGSTLSVYLARAGQVKQFLIDEADLAPHHLVRHALPPEYVGKNKAEGLKEHITSIYRLDQDSLGLRAFPHSVYDLLDTPEAFAETSHLIDATASAAVLNALVTTNLPPHVHCSRCEIANDGRLGILLWEGPRRNPRLDDLQCVLFALGWVSPAISHWLNAHQRQAREERAAALEEIGIGVSCSSTTLRLADDVVAFHTSLFSNAYKKREHWSCETGGRIQISLLATDSEIVARTETIDVPAVRVLSSSASPNWEVRVHAQVLTKVTRWMTKAGRNETGGLLLGLAHKKRRLIYVTDVLPASPDSKGTPYAFERGVKDYPEILDTVEARTGGLIGYVGEWHSHPNGSTGLSDRDHAAVRAIRKHLDSAGLPAHIVVFAEDRIEAFVFDSTQSP